MNPKDILIRESFRFGMFKKNCEGEISLLHRKLYSFLIDCSTFCCTEN